MDKVMMNDEKWNTTLIKERLQNQDIKFQEMLLDVYVDSQKIEYQRKRYYKAIETFEESYGVGEIEIYSAPGRSEIGGNHTDHQHGQVLAAAINLDAIAIVRPINQLIVEIISDGYDKVVVNLNALEKQEEEKETTTALIKGVLAGLQKQGYVLGGFQAYITSDVLIGAGLSSSAAYETLIGTIVSGLYNQGCVSAVTIAEIGQFAENEYFGKPCGLMDQMACSVGSLVHIDFADITSPVIEKLEMDIEHYGYSLCITDTKGSHADLTSDYAAIPLEMKQIATFFGKDVLHDVTKEQVLENMNQLRKLAGDRAVLRAFHFFNENVRVEQEVHAIQAGDIQTFLMQVKASGDSSYKYLQNIYSNADVKQQNMSLALMLSEMILGDQGACRVHGGGFAGTIQAFVKNEIVDNYKRQMNQVFGEDACKVLKIRKYGGMKIL